MVKTHPQAVFSAAGNGLVRDNPAVIELMAQAGLPAHAVDLRGEIGDMPAFYQSIDLLVLSSRTEGFPNVIAEAMSFGKPIVRRMSVTRPRSPERPVSQYRRATRKHSPVRCAPFSTCRRRSMRVMRARHANASKVSMRLLR